MIKHLISSAAFKTIFNSGYHDYHGYHNPKEVVMQTVKFSHLRHCKGLASSKTQSPCKMEYISGNTVKYIKLDLIYKSVTVLNQ